MTNSISTPVAQALHLEIVNHQEMHKEQLLRVLEQVRTSVKTIRVSSNLLLIYQVWGEKAFEAKFTIEEGRPEGFWFVDVKNSIRGRYIY